MPGDPGPIYRNIVQYLQKQPLAYRNFGVFWYALKARLKKAGYTTDHLQHLGEYTEQDLVDRFASLDDEAFLSAALEDHETNAATNWLGQWQVDPETSEGVFILDQDVGR